MNPCPSLNHPLPRILNGRREAMIETIQVPVTGREQVADDSSPLSALSQFYRALNTRDIALMEQNWDSSDEAAMDNPLGGIRRGWAEIRSVYQRLFDAPNRYSLNFMTTRCSVTERSSSP